MIMQRLVEAFDRLREEERIPPLGYEKREIPFIIVLDRAGLFVDLLDTRHIEGKVKRGRLFEVPRSVQRSGTKAWEKAFVLWDNPKYVVGLPGNPSIHEKHHKAFKEKLDEVFPDFSFDEGIRAVRRFLEAGDFSMVYGHSNWKEVEQSQNNNIAFRLDGELGLISDGPAVRTAVTQYDLSQETAPGECLVTHEEGMITDLHDNLIQGVWKAQTSGAYLVSFNKEAYCSYKRPQSRNAPVSRRAMLAYTSALNHFLARDSRQRMQIGDSTAVFWAANETPMEELLADLFGDVQAGTASARDADTVRALLTAPRSGSRPLVDDPTEFFILGLAAPGKARIAVRFWHSSPVADIARKILQYFDDIRIDHHPEAADYPTLSTLLRCTAVQGKLDNIPPNLAGETMGAILSGRRFPRSLLATAIRRTRSERVVTHPRAALIKAALARQNRFSTHPIQEVDVSLDPNNSNPGYRLGRLFAVLERAQERANPGINATIRDRYYGSASSTPVVAFPLLMKLNTHHLAKLENRGEAVNLGKRIGEIVDGLSTFPAHLSLDDQGRFAIGYYHQRQRFFQKSSDTTPGGDQ